MNEWVSSIEYYTWTCDLSSLSLSLSFSLYLYLSLPPSLYLSLLFSFSLLFSQFVSFSFSFCRICVLGGKSVHLPVSFLLLLSLSLSLSPHTHNYYLQISLVLFISIPCVGSFYWGNKLLYKVHEWMDKWRNGQVNEWTNELYCTLNNRVPTCDVRRATSSKLLVLNNFVTMVWWSYQPQTLNSPWSSPLLQWFHSDPHAQALLVRTSNRDDERVWR